MKFVRLRRCYVDEEHWDGHWCFFAPSLRRTRLIVLALTPCSSAKSISLDPAKYEATTVGGSTLARPVVGDDMRPDGGRMGAPVPGAGRV